MRRIAICLIALVVLAGCGERTPRYARGYALSTVALKEQVAPDGQVFSYSHALALVMPHDAVRPRFERARDRCLHDAALDCKLISASISANNGGYQTGDEASLLVALPHDKIAVFEKAVLEPVAEDGTGKVTVQSRSTTAENVATQASDNEHKVAQLTAYRDRLEALAKRGDLSVADIMKVEAELSKVQGDLDAALTEKRDIGERIAKETLSISLGETESAIAPIAQTWNNAGDTLLESTASALAFLIQIVPWLPIAGGGIVLVGWLWRLVRRKKTA